MLPTPTKYALVAGKGDGRTILTAFDAALLDAGAGNLNLLRVSSILPPNCQLVPELRIPPGSLVPVAYGTISSAKPGDTIAAAIGVGISEDTYGVIMEFEGFCTKEEAEETVANMVREGFANRHLPLVNLKVKGIEHQVEEVGSVFAAAVMWYESLNNYNNRII